MLFIDLDRCTLTMDRENYNLPPLRRLSAQAPIVHTYFRLHKKTNTLLWLHTVFRAINYDSYVYMKEARNAIRSLIKLQITSSTAVVVKVWLPLF